MCHPEEMNPIYYAGEKQQQQSWGFHLNQKSFADGQVKRQLAWVVIETELLKQTETLQRQHLKSVDDLPLVAVATAVVVVVAAAAAEDDADSDY